MTHEYGIHPVGAGSSLRCWIAECSCGWSEEAGAKDAARRLAVAHVGGDVTPVEPYRPRRFVLDPDGMDEMFPGVR